MNGEPNASNGANSLDPGGATLVGMLAGAVALILCGGALFLFGQWLLGKYGPALDWPAYPVPAIALGVIPAMLAMHGCRKARWGEILTAFLAASTVAAVLATNIVAAVAMLWAFDPVITRGQDGFFAAGVAGLLLSLPVAFGASTLLQRRQTMGTRQSALFIGVHFQRPPWLAFPLVIVGFLMNQALFPWFSGWLLNAHPAASGFFLSGAKFGAFLAVISFFFTKPLDLRSMLRSLLAALIILESAVAGGIAAAVVAITLRSDSVLLSMSPILLTLTLLVGAVLYVILEPGGRGNGAADAGPEEEAPGA